MAERVWDRFLTEHDKAHLARRSRPRTRRVLGGRPAILNIDNYRGAAGDARGDVLDQVGDWPSAMGHVAWDALDNVATLLAAARGAGIPCAHVTGLGEEHSGIASWTGRPSPDLSAMTPEQADRHRRRHDFMPQAAPIDGEIVLRKNAPSAFFGTPLAAALRGLDVDTLIVTGESTSGCVRASVVDARSHRFNVIVVEECVYDRHESTHAINLFDMDQKYAPVLPLAEVLAWIETWRGDATTHSPE